MRAVKCLSLRSSSTSVGRLTVVSCTVLLLVLLLCTVDAEARKKRFEGDFEFVDEVSDV